MLQYASQGVRNAARKGSNALIHHSGHNGPGGGTTSASTSKALHISSIISGAAHSAHAPPVPINSLEAIRPRNPANRLFSASKNLLQRAFTHLSAPGLRVPVNLPQVQRAGARSLHNASTTIQGNLSFAARNSLKNNALRRQANTFLPRGPSAPPPRCGGVTQVGLGTARNFSTGRPIFQQLAENVPIAGRALYEVDWDIEMRKEHEKMRFMAMGGPKALKKSKEVLKPTQKIVKFEEPSQRVKDTKEAITEEELNHYFPVEEVAPITTYLLIPLAPTPSSRMPLSLDSGSSPAAGPYEPTLLPPLSYLGAMHSSHSTHALRVSTLFTRLDQANVWSRGGVTCSAYSQGLSHHRQVKEDDGTSDGEGVCTILKVEFVGWTKAEVRSIIGESGSGWCVLEEVAQGEEAFDDDSLSDIDTSSSDIWDERSPFAGTPDLPDLMGPQLVDPAQSFVLPTLDFSSSGSSSPALSRTVSIESIPSGMETDPWIEDYDFSSSSGSSSYSDLSELIIEPPSTNGYFGQRHSLGPGVSFGTSDSSEPREGMFY